LILGQDRNIRRVIRLAAGREAEDRVDALHAVLTRTLSNSPTRIAKGPAASAWARFAASA
jgi:hypothetical protein